MSYFDADDSCVLDREPIGRIGCLLVGLAGNNGSTLWALRALRSMYIRTKNDPDHSAAVWGSMIMYADVPLCSGKRVRLRDVLKTSRLPATLESFVVIDGWDVSETVTLQDALIENEIVPARIVADFKSRKLDEIKNPIAQGIVDPDFISVPITPNSNRSPGPEGTDADINRIVRHIDTFARNHQLEFVVVFYSGSKERTSASNDKLLSPSQMYALATCRSRTRAMFINGSAQTCTLDLQIVTEFEAKGRIILGNDLATCDTSVQSALFATFLGQGIPIQTIVQHQYLGNRDGLNLTQESAKCKSDTANAGAEKLQQFAPSIYTNQILDMNLEQFQTLNYVASIGDNKRSMTDLITCLPFGHKGTVCINSVGSDTAFAMGVMTDLMLLGVILAHATVNGRRLTTNQANAIVSCLFKNPSSDRARLSFHENRDILIGFLLHLCGKQPETWRHLSILS